MTWKFSRRSANLLSKVHPDLRAVTRLALEKSPLDFAVTEGIRDLATQKKNVAEGSSRTLNSRHLTGHAVDFAPYVDGQISGDFKHAAAVAWAFKEASRELHTPIVWGGDWKSRDGVHIQLDWAAYPLEGQPVKTAKNSKTVWAAAMAPVVVAAPELLDKAMQIADSSVALGDIAKWVAIVGVAALGLVVAIERLRKINEHGL